MVRLGSRLWLAERGFTLFSQRRQATGKASIGSFRNKRSDLSGRPPFLSAFRLLPRLEEVYIRRANCRQPPRFARRRATNSQEPGFDWQLIFTGFFSVGGFTAQETKRFFRNNCFPWNF